MGSILLVFAGVTYWQALDDLEDLDRLLLKKTRVMVVKYELQAGSRPGKCAAFGSTLPPLGTELVYVRWYDPKGQLVQFFGTTPAQLTSSGFHTIETASSPTQARFTAPGCVR